MKTNSFTKLIWSLVLIVSMAFASDPAYYIKKGSWQETLRISREALTNIEKQDGLDAVMPDLGASGFTLMAWIKTESQTGCILMKAPDIRSFFVDPFDPESQSKALYLQDGIPVYQISSVGVFSSGNKVNDGQWHHIVLTGKSPLVFYIDGQKVKSGEIAGSTEVFCDAVNHNFSIAFGTEQFPKGGAYSGFLDEVRMYNRELSKVEIATVYKNKMPVEKGLVGWWQFEEGEENNDSSVNEHRGRVYNGEFVSGKYGNGVHFKGNGGVWLRRSTGLTARAKIWQLVERDFEDAESAKERHREQRDGIWQRDWQPGDIGDLMQRYLQLVRDVGGFTEKAKKLVASMKRVDNLKKIRSLYHRSLQFEKQTTDLSAKIKSLRAAIHHLAEKYPQKYRNAPAYLEDLADLEKNLQQNIKTLDNPDALKASMQKINTLQYKALVTDNPLFDFDELVFVKRYSYTSSHYYTDFIDGTENPGGNLSIFSLKDGSVNDLFPEMNKGIFGRYDLSFDANKIVFDWKERIGKGFRLFESSINGSAFRQLTFEPADETERVKWYDNSNLGGTSRVYQHHTDDMQPCYLPDGGIIFTSTRCEFGVLCDGPDKLTSSILYRIDGNGQNMQKLTNSAVSEFAPSVMHDGRIIYSRWEYVDKGQIGVKCLWAMRPDGSGTAEIFGNDIALPPVFTLPRAIPGYNNLFVTLGTPHFPQSGVGTVIRLDINKPIRTREPMTYITPHIDIRAEPGFDHWVDGKWVRNEFGPLYMDPYPLSDKFFLVSHNPDKRWNDLRAYGLYLIDEFGNHVKIYQDPEYSAWQPIPLKSRPVPPVIPTTRPPVAAATPATVVLSDVYEGLDGIERGTVKYIRVMEQVPRPWDCRIFWEEDGGAPAVSAGSVLGLKVLHGIVPVYEDGSAHFIVPADKNIYFQALDEDYMEIQRQRTYINYRPGEKRACIGCHELRQFAPANKPVMALQFEPSHLQPQPGEIAPRVVHYPSDVQPVLDKNCVSCHSGKTAASDLDLSGELTETFSRSYENIISRGLVKTYNEGSDFDGTEAVPPRTVGSHASKLITILLDGHQDLNLTIEEMLKLTTWVDANAQYYGSWYGRRNIRYKDHPNFRPVPSFEDAISSKIPFNEINVQAKK